MLMHGLHWAWALPMQADLRTEKKNFPQSVSHQIRTPCFCQTCIHSSVFFPGSISRRKVCTVPQTSLPDFIFSFILVENLCGSCGCFLGLLRNGSEKDLKRTLQYRSLPEYALEETVCLPWERNQARIEIWTKKRCTLAWTSPILCLVFLLCILLDCPHSMSLSSKAQGQGMEGPQRALNRALFPNGGLMAEFLCVFQGSAGA